MGRGTAAAGAPAADLLRSVCRLREDRPLAGDERRGGRREGRRQKDRDESHGNSLSLDVLRYPDGTDLYHPLVDDWRSEKIQDRGPMPQ